MNSNAPTFPLKTITSALFASSFIFAVLDVQAAVSQSPLSLTVSVPPNLILTLDDSGSMSRAYVSDAINYSRDTQRAKSSHFNAMYYNPKITYRIPPRFNTDGTASGTPFSTSFSNAPINGFNSTKGSVNLSTDYRPTWSYRVINTTQTYAENPGFRHTLDLTLSNGQTSSARTHDGVTFQVRRVNNSTCQVIVTAPSDHPPINCSRSYDTYTLKQADATIGIAAYYYIFDTTLTNCPANQSLQKDNDNCYRKVEVSNNSGTVRADDIAAGTDERNNFAIWYSFYRTRALTTISAASLAFAELPASTRITWQALESCTKLNSTNECLGGRNLFREYTTAQRGDLYNWLYTMDFNSWTPLRAALDRAGKFLQTDKAAWQKFPNGPSADNTAANTYSCRPSYHIMMTDGVWNKADGSVTGLTRFDHQNFDLPDGKKYSNTRTPYADTTENTLADLAMHYWATDLNDTLANKIKPYYADNKGTEAEKYWNARNNPATWQHMVNFTVGLGLTSSLNQSNLEWDDEKGTFESPGYRNILNGTASWPEASEDSVNNVYDLWHAAINSRGEFFSAESPEAIIQAFKDIMSRIAERKSVAAKPAINSGQVVEDVTDGTKVTTVSYQTSYSSEDNWAGDLTRSDKERKFNAATGTYVDSFSQQWSAKDKMPAPAARNIRIKGSGSSGLQAFTWSNAGNAATVGTLANLLSRDPEKGNAADSRGEARLNYLRGVRTDEGTTFRTRSSVLGDLYSSSPVVVSRARYLNSFANRLEGGTAYTTFAASICSSNCVT